MQTERESVKPDLQNRRERADEDEVPTEPQRIITVRLPKSLHESLKAEAHERKTSMNQLCIDRLLRLPDVAGSEA